ncbi:hypothetical protein N657DRAFT_280610 [Parathielavia appendiculata]|uniref:Uncharacterized protein n=1 Tax=Parathielavia appendiculata TaxID=2587402 RepID=A0AAN6U6B5_9PEZI|nr:hypothetical protein N657DRAFT_280610 [Parathielavia appendiculata]
MRKGQRSSFIINVIWDAVCSASGEAVMLLSIRGWRIPRLRIKNHRDWQRRGTGMSFSMLQPSQLGCRIMLITNRPSSVLQSIPDGEV